MTTDAALSSRLPSSFGSDPTDVALLALLSEVSVSLRHLRHEAAKATTDLRQRRMRVARIETLLRADSRALETLHNSAGADQVTIDVLDTAVAGGQRAFASAKERAASGTESLGPLLERLSKAIADLERQADDLRSQLSPSTARAVAALSRTSVLPLVSTLDRGACGQCHLRLPTALASSTSLHAALHRCPHCKRILVPARSDAAANAS